MQSLTRQTHSHIPDTIPGEKPRQNPNFTAETLTHANEKPSRPSCVVKALKARVFPTGMQGTPVADYPSLVQPNTSEQEFGKESDAIGGSLFSCYDISW